jgi:hypothetical protein
MLNVEVVRKEPVENDVPVEICAPGPRLLISGAPRDFPPSAKFLSFNI